MRTREVDRVAARGQGRCEQERRGAYLGRWVDRPRQRHKPGLNVNGPEGMPASAGPGSSPRSDGGTRDGLRSALQDRNVRREEVLCRQANRWKSSSTKDGERLWIGFNDERGQYLDNHLGKGRRHELDPLWVRIEVVRIVVD